MLEPACGSDGKVVEWLRCLNASASNENSRCRWDNCQPNIKVPSSFHGTNTDGSGPTSAHNMYDNFVSGCNMNSNEDNFTLLCDNKENSI